MDPLSVTASIIAVLQLSATVLGYLSDVRDASKDRAKCAAETANAYSLLMNLKAHLDERSADVPWYNAVRALGVENGPLEQYKQALEELQNKLRNGSRLRKAGQAVVWSLKKEEFTMILNRIERLKTLVGIALQMDHFKLSQAIREDTNFVRTQVPAIQSGVERIWQDRVDKKYSKVLEWISPINYFAQQSDIIARKQEGTGQWFLDAAGFVRWLNEPKSTLFCPGIPGAGKTMVAAIAIEHLLKTKQSRPVGVACVFFNYKAQEEQSASSMLAAIVKQLVQYRTSVTEPLVRLHKQHDQQGTRPSLEEILNVLRGVIADFSTVYFVVDALDECQDKDGSRRLFLAKLRDLQAVTDVRLMATSRFVPDIEDEFKQAKRLEIRASDEDIRRFVAGQMYRLPKCIRCDSELQKLVEERITERVDGMFLLARLHIDSLLDKTTAKKVKTTLANLSKGSAALDDAYKDALQRIQSQLDGHYELAKNVLSWITYARRPLTTAELCCALAVEPQDVELDPDNLPEIEDLLSVCAGLVIVEPESAVIRLVHYTTQEYFERIIDAWNPSALVQIASTCLTYLSFDEFRTGSCSSDEEFEKRLREKEFLVYAAEHWGEHALLVQNEVRAPICLFLCNSKLVACATQVCQASRSRFPGHSQMYPKDNTGLHLAARWGLSSTIESILTNEEEIEAVLEHKNSNSETPLLIAVENGHYGTTELLLQKGANVNVQGGNYGDALRAASAKGFEAIAELLLNKGAKVNAQDGAWSTPLYIASRYGRQEILELLLKEGADVNARGENRGTALDAAISTRKDEIVKVLLRKGADPNAASKGSIPLQKASARGYKNIVELLIKHGADVNARGGLHDSAIKAASAQGHLEVVKLLLEKGAEANEQDEGWGTALYAASERGFNKIVELLLEKGADANAGDGFTALHIASARGHLEVVEVLLEKGAEVNKQDEVWGTPIYTASLHGHDKIVELLLEKGADVNAREEPFGTPLEAASQMGHNEVVRILRDAGAC